MSLDLGTLIYKIRIEPEVSLLTDEDVKRIAAAVADELEAREKKVDIPTIKKFISEMQKSDSVKGYA